MKTYKTFNLTIKDLLKTIDGYNYINAMFCNKSYCAELENNGLTDYRISYFGQGLEDLSDTSVKKFNNIYEIKKI